MKILLFTTDGRICRSQCWKGVFLVIVFTVALALVWAGLTQVIPGEPTANGSYSVDGVKAIPFAVLGLGYFVFSVWSGLCLGIKRYHDRNKSGFWVLIQFVPIIGALWYFIETGCLAGTPGPNRYGPDPRRTMIPPASLPMAG